VILKAYGGKSSKIKDILRIYNSKKYALLSTPEMIIEAMDSSKNSVDIGVNLEDVLCEVIELTAYVQAKVKHSLLDATFGEIVNQQGLFDPCVDINENRALFMQYAFKGVVKHHILFSK